MKNLVSVFVTLLFFSFSSQGFGQKGAGLAGVDNEANACHNPYVIISGGNISSYGNENGSSNCLSPGNSTIVFDLDEMMGGGMSGGITLQVGNTQFNGNYSGNNVSYDLGPIFNGPPLGQSVTVTITIPPVKPGAPPVTCTQEIPVCPGN